METDIADINQLVLMMRQQPQGSIMRRMRRYARLVAIQTALQQEAPFTAEEYAMESLKIHGRSAEDIEANQQEKDEFKIYVGLVDTFMRSPPENPIDHPLPVVAAICGPWVGARPRRGGFVHVGSGIPRGDMTKQLLERWLKFWNDRIERSRQRPVHAATRNLWSFAFHDSFVALRAYVEGNERAARAMFPAIRRKLNLPQYIFREQETPLHAQRMSYFRLNLAPEFIRAVRPHLSPGELLGNLPNTLPN
jgi:hypothetical protein